jgi:hypothetical protein
VAKRGARSFEKETAAFFAVILSPDARVRAQSGKKPRRLFAVILSPDARVRARSGKKRLLV